MSSNRNDRDSGHNSPDLSPPRRKRQRARSTTPVEDLSPPRHSRHANKPVSSPNQSLQREPSLSPPRRRAPREESLSPPRSRRATQEQSLSPPRRRAQQQSQEDGDRSLSPPRNKRQRTESLSPPRRSRKPSPSLSPPRRATITKDDPTSTSISTSIPTSHEQNLSSESKTILRDSTGRQLTEEELQTLEEIANQKNDPKFVSYQDTEYGGGLVQRQEMAKAKAERKEALASAKQIYATVSGPLTVTGLEKEKIIDYDPLTILSRQKRQENAVIKRQEQLKRRQKKDKKLLDAYQQAVANGDQKRIDKYESMIQKKRAREQVDHMNTIRVQAAQVDFSVVRDNDGKLIKHVKRPMYQGEPWKNRYNILPGFRWDGVDRSNGWETKRRQALNNS